MATSAPSTLRLGQAGGELTVTSCIIHPTVVFSVLDHYVRRREGQGRIIGTLLGAISDDGVVSVRSAFPVPHDEEENVAVDMDFHRNMFELLQRSSPDEIIVGWYASGRDVSENSVLIHEFYGNEMQDTPLQPVHMTVDTDLDPATGLMHIATYVSNAITLGSKPLGSCFARIPHTYDAEDVHALLHHKDTPQIAQPLLSDFGSLENSMKSLVDMLEEVAKYCRDAADGKVSIGIESLFTPVALPLCLATNTSEQIKGNPKVGRLLASTVAFLPQIDADSFETMYNDSTQDILMVVYLSQLTRNQLMVAQRLQASTN